jgi:esterase
VHGGGLTAHTWDVVCLLLRSHCRALAIDLRGHGDSDWSAEEDYDLGAYGRDIAAVVESLDGPDRLVLVGHSLGGLASLAFTLDNPTYVDGLVLVDVGLRSQVTGRARIEAFMIDTAQPRPFRDYVEYALRFNPRRGPKQLSNSLRNSLRQLAPDSWVWKYDPRQFSPSARAKRMRSKRQLDERVERLSCPVLVLRGAESDVFLDADADELAGRLPNAVWSRIPGAGHTIQGDQPRRLARELREFFRRLDDRDSSHRPALTESGEASLRLPPVQSPASGDEP